MDYNTQKKCGFCGETIPRGANRCPYCGSILEVTVDDSFSENGSEPYQNTETNNVQQQNAPQQTDDVSNNAEGIGQTSDMEGQAGAAPKNNVDRQDGDILQSEPSRQEQGVQRPYYPRKQEPVATNNGKMPLSNGLKVFLTVLFTGLPGVGQLAGIITAIVFMSSDGDSDRKSFGVALLVACLALFVLSCIGCFTLFIVGQSISYY